MLSKQPVPDDTDSLQTLLLPALISLGIFVLLSYFLVPLWQRYRAKYSRYIPLETISSQTTSLRERIQHAIAQRLMPSTWSSNYPGQSRYAVDAQDSDDNEDGEELFEIDERRREALSLDANRGLNNDGRRLSRDLEEGFRDDSDEDIPVITRVQR